MPYESFSGGEKVKISVAINEALAELTKINFRVLDETVVSLDNESTQKFLEALTRIQETVSQVICVSHIPEIKDMFDEKINIIKTNGDSRLDDKKIERSTNGNSGEKVGTKEAKKQSSSIKKSKRKGGIV